MIGDMPAVVVLMVVAVLGTSVWVFVDAHKNSRSVMWGIGCLLLHLVVFPIYLGKHRRTVSPGVAPFMWIAWAAVLVLWIVNLVQTI